MQRTALRTRRTSCNCTHDPHLHESLSSSACPSRQRRSLFVSALAACADAAPRRGVKAARTGAQSKAERLNAARQQREAKRAAVLEARRGAAPPRVVALLPLSADVDVDRLWSGLLAACSSPLDDGGAAAPAAAAAGGMEVELDVASPPLAPATLALADRRRLRFTFLPPPSPRDDPLAVVELARAAECVLLAMPGDVGTDTIDEAGSAALGVLRALGLPSVLALVQAPAAAAGKNAMKERAAAKKHATAALQEQVGGACVGCVRGGALAVLVHSSDPPLACWGNGLR